MREEVAPFTFHLNFRHTNTQYAHILHSNCPKGDKLCPTVDILVSWKQILRHSSQSRKVRLSLSLSSPPPPLTVCKLACLFFSNCQAHLKRENRKHCLRGRGKRSKLSGKTCLLSFSVNILSLRHAVHTQLLYMHKSFTKFYL